uniref:Uncharacterized protein n=1 Tax=Candidozyma auris TaxID=498019 RepID=A0A0L0NPD8_CANAR
MASPQGYVQRQQGSVSEAPSKVYQPNTAAPAISYTPTEVNIPSKLYDKVPNLNLYKKLQDAEKQLDLLIAQKGLDFQSVQASSMQANSMKRETGILRVFIYNTCQNQPWQNNQSKVNETSNTDSSWTLRVEGRFISDSPEVSEAKEMKFSSFLSGISIEIVPNEDYPSLQGSQSNIIEWRNEGNNNGNNQGGNSQLSNGSLQWLFDGIDVTRQGVFPIKSKIAILTKDYTFKLLVSQEMAQFTGKREASQQELIYLIWQYVLFKKLFKRADSYSNVPAVPASSMSSQALNSQSNEETDLSVVQCDEVLKDLLKVNTFKFKDLYQLIQPHVRPRQPIVLDYEIDTTRSTTLGDVVVDIPVELALSMGKMEKEIIDENKSAFESMSKSDELVQYLNQRISLGIVALQSSNNREQFYRELSDDPVVFIKKWLESQSETLKALKSEEGFNEEDVRKAQYFKEHEQELRQKIDLMLGAQKL